MAKNISKNLVLKDGSSVAVIGGGPAGSLFTFFALDFAQRFDLDIKIDIIESKNFKFSGPKGCNNCGRSFYAGINEGLILGGISHKKIVGFGCIRKSF